MFGFSNRPFLHHPVGVQFGEDRCQHLPGYCHAVLDAVGAIHQHFGFDDRQQAGFLAKRGITRQRVRIADKAKLENAPGFDKDHWPAMTDDTWALQVPDYYGQQTYW